jgi:molecular chaperone DnaK
VRETVEKLNKADTLIFQTEKQLKEYGDKIPAEKRATIEAAKERLKAAHMSADMNGIDSAEEELNNAWTAASEEMYKGTQGNEPGGQQAGGAHQHAGTDNGGFADAEYEEVK